ncbi:MAG: hypothetical protein WKG00_21260 [Polyangiaceae bacterium]
MLVRNPSTTAHVARHRQGKHLLAIAAAAGALASSWSATARADQFVVFDDTWTFTADLPDSHYRLEPLPATPADLTSPVDYTGGTVHVYLEVTSKPTDEPTKFQVCLEANPTYACTYQSMAYTDVGILDWETPWDGFWSPAGESVDWSQGINKVAVILKDTNNGKPSAGNVGDEVAALYTPTDVRGGDLRHAGRHLRPAHRRRQRRRRRRGRQRRRFLGSAGGSSGDATAASGGPGPSAGSGGESSGSGGAGASGGAPADLPPARWTTAATSAPSVPGAARPGASLLEPRRLVLLAPPRRSRPGGGAARAR